jgi:hypothetical protein
MTQQVISANRLTDGIVVYLTEAGDWSEQIAAALLLKSKEAHDQAMMRAGEAVARQIVVDPYPIDIDTAAGDRRPTRYREFIRANGPSVRRDLGKQAETR